MGTKGFVLGATLDAQAGTMPRGAAADAAERFLKRFEVEVCGVCRLALLPGGRCEEHGQQTAPPTPRVPDVGLLAEDWIARHDVPADTFPAAAIFRTAWALNAGAAARPSASQVVQAMREHGVQLNVDSWARVTGGAFGAMPTGLLR